VTRVQNVKKIKLDGSDLVSGMLSFVDNAHLPQEHNNLKETQGYFSVLSNPRNTAIEIPKLHEATSVLLFKPLTKSTSPLNKARRSSKVEGEIGVKNFSQSEQTRRTWRNELYVQQNMLCKRNCTAPSARIKAK
jgi:hypothetical protein